MISVHSATTTIIPGAKNQGRITAFVEDVLLSLDRNVVLVAGLYMPSYLVIRFNQTNFTLRALLKIYMQWHGCGHRNVVVFQIPCHHRRLTSPPSCRIIHLKICVLIPALFSQSWLSFRNKSVAIAGRERIRAIKGCRQSVYRCDQKSSAETPLVCSKPFIAPMFFLVWRPTDSILHGGWRKFDRPLQCLSRPSGNRRTRSRCVVFLR
nr:hypothetical protein CFP56_64720 [Quercus suber]